MTDSGVETEVVKADVNVELVSVSPMLSRGSLRALVHAIISINGIEFAVNNIQLCRESQGWIVRAPQCRNANGVWVSAIEMDQSLLNTVLELAADEVAESADPRNYRK